MKIESNNDGEISITCSGNEYLKTRQGVKMAEIKVVKDTLNDMTIFVVRGGLSTEEIIDKVKDYYSGNPTRLVLWDMTEAATVGDIATAELKQIINTVKNLWEKRFRGKTAIVISTDVDFGLGRIYMVHAEFNLPYKYAIFRDVVAARKWLLNDNNA